MIATDNDLQTKIPFALTNVYDFAGFTTLTAQMVAEGTTTGPVKSESRIDATKLNIQRINRLIKTCDLLNRFLSTMGPVKPYGKLGGPSSKAKYWSSDR